MRLLICVLLLLLGSRSYAQIDPERLRQPMERAKWVKSGQTLEKAHRKDSLDTEPLYLLSLYYINGHNPAFQIDSADRYCRRAWNRFGKITQRERDRLHRLPLDTAHLMALRRQVDSSAFEQAKAIHTESSYISFIQRFPFANEVHTAAELRDELAFTDALKKNSWQAYFSFYNRYPSSHRAREAFDRYDKLLYEDKTGDHKLASYLGFYYQYTASAYRAEAERNIFELMTASGHPKDLVRFAKKFPGSKWTELTRKLLYGLSADDPSVFPQVWHTDSIKKLESLQQRFWVPVYRTGKYGFINADGQEVMAEQFDGIDESYRCGAIEDPWIITSSGLVARNGHVIFNGRTEKVKDLGSGFLLVGSDSGRYVVHQSGYRPLAGRVEEAMVLAGRYLAVKRQGKWGITSFSGRALAPFRYDAAESIDTLVVLTRGGKKELSVAYKIAQPSEAPSASGTLICDDLRRWGEQEYWVRNGSLEGVVNARLEFILPLDRQVLRKMSFGYLRGKERVYVNGIPSLENQAFSTVDEQGNWVRLRRTATEALLYDRTEATVHTGDSAWFQGPLPFLQRGDSVHVFLPGHQEVSFKSGEEFYLREYKNHAWVILPRGKKKVVYHAVTGQRLFAMECDMLDPVSENLFLVTKGTRKGIAGLDGKLVVPMEYDAIVPTGATAFSLLKDRKFGWYEASAKLLTKPAYDRNLKPYNQRLTIGYKGTACGFIGADGKANGAFEWEEIQYWNDSVAWVKRNGSWKLWDIPARVVKMDNIRAFNPIDDNEYGKTYLVQQDRNWGVLHNKRGVIVPLQYTDIVNLGTPDWPLYFTERHIEEAGISVVIYFDRNGHIVRKQAMEAAEFEKIYCEN